MVVHVNTPAENAEVANLVGVGSVAKWPNSKSRIYIWLINKTRDRFYPMCSVFLHFTRKKKRNGKSRQKVEEIH